MMKKVTFAVIALSALASCTLSSSQEENKLQERTSSTSEKLAMDNSWKTCNRRFEYVNVSHRRQITSVAALTTLNTCNNVRAAYPGNISFLASDACVGSMNDMGVTDQAYVGETMDYVLYAYGTQPARTSSQRRAMARVNEQPCGIGPAGATQYALARAQNATTARPLGSSLYATTGRYDYQLCNNYYDYDSLYSCYVTKWDQTLRSMMSYDNSVTLSSPMLGAEYAIHPFIVPNQTSQLYWTDEDGIPVYCAKRGVSMQHCTYGELMDFAYGFLSQAKYAQSGANNLSAYAIKVIKRGKELAYGGTQTVGGCEQKFFTKYRFSNYPNEIWSAQSIANFYLQNPGFLFCLYP